MTAKSEMVTFTRREVAGLGAASAVGVGGAAFGLSRVLMARAQEATPEAAASPHAGHGVDASPSAGTVPPTPFYGVTGQPLVEPEVRASVNGVLETSLTAALGPVTVAGQSVTSMVYDGSFPGPTLRAKPGDTIRVKLTNNLDQVTNLHTHGFHVSPKDNSDNIFLHIETGQTFDFEYVLPADHSPGMYW